MPMNNKSDG